MTVRNALADFFFDHLCEDLDPDAIDGKAKRCSLLAHCFKATANRDFIAQLMID